MSVKYILQNESQIFPPTTGGGAKLSEDSHIPLLGKLPLDPRIGKLQTGFQGELIHLID